ncbi:GntR family transcriptional regulator [Bacillus sp. 03113]|uniref:GntR family transcriptional regulator n=1 Tax=Bacillus sp. 03113 TaxID=2578211 RepID=UPI0011437CB4|nr:GntR family transcriptional regulator [Bacillus sp. 03113]
MRIILSNSSPHPIYHQIYIQIRDHILNGEITGGEQLPSIRSLAKELQISVITTKRAYEELESDGLIETVAGKGSFVSIKNEELIREKKLYDLECLMEKVVKECRILNLSQQEMFQMIKMIWEE